MHRTILVLSLILPMMSGGDSGAQVLSPEKSYRGMASLSSNISQNASSANATKSDCRTPPECLTAKPEKLPWPHQRSGLNSEEIKKLNQEVWVINNFSLYQANEPGTWSYFHGGLDIVLDNGTKIYAMKDGWVKAVIYDSTVIISDTKEDQPSYAWEYSHLGNLTVKVGDFVKKGTFIGEVNFKGLPHIHLAKAFSKSNNWEIQHYISAPNAHFTYIDKEPPIIKNPFYFFENNSDKIIKPKASGDIVLRGDVDIVVGMRDAGFYARSKENGFGDRLGVTRIDYEICPVQQKAASQHRFQSFDFEKLRIPKDPKDRKYNTAYAKIVYKHWTLLEDKRTNWNKVVNYYIISNCSGQKPPDELKLNDNKYSWNTAALDKNGHPVFPDGKYDITVIAADFIGNIATETMRVTVANHSP